VYEVILFTPKKFVDNRGWFSETYNKFRESKLGIDAAFVQDNRSFSTSKGTIRGIHFQLPPRGQAKLVSCTRGSLTDYVIDLRNGSPTYGNHLEVALNPENGHQLYIPIGFGHAFVTLEDATEISYKVTEYYSAEADSGIRWNCPDLNISWPVSPTEAIVSEKDGALPLLNDFESPFDYTGHPLRLKIVD
jgi:dTDP-4-dehydrorhamnose 3,5-epimerase